MRIAACCIENFKSIRKLAMEEMETAVILVGKNNTGKSVVMEAILSAMGYLPIEENDFCDADKPIRIEVTLEIQEEDLWLLYQNKKVSRQPGYDQWREEFHQRLPDYVEDRISFCFVAESCGSGYYLDRAGNKNPYIKEILPNIRYIDHDREIQAIQEDIFHLGADERLNMLRENSCIYDAFTRCNQCFRCIEEIKKKTAEELDAYEAARLLEYKIFHTNINRFNEAINSYFHKNSGRSQDIKTVINVDVDRLCQLETYVINHDRKKEGSIYTLGAGMKSIYLLSLMEAYIAEPGVLPTIIMIEDPEIFLHPQMQKVAGEILYRLSKKNQVFFTTHSPNMLFNFSSKQIKQVVLDEEFTTIVRENPDIDEILDDLGYTANDLMNVSFVFIVEGKQDGNRLPLLLEKYYSEIYDDDGSLQRISIIPTNSCTNIKTYANLKYINKLYLKDQFLMIRDSDGKNPNHLVKQLCSYYGARAREDDQMLRVQPKNVLILKYYSFENYFLDPAVMTKIGVVKSEEEFYNILYDKYKSYLYKLPSMKRMIKITGARIRTKEDLKANMENIKIYVRGHNLYDIFYGRYRNREQEILKKYIDAAPREVFANILDAIDKFVYFESRKKDEKSEEKQLEKTNKK